METENDQENKGGTTVARKANLRRSILLLFVALLSSSCARAQSAGAPPAASSIQQPAQPSIDFKSSQYLHEKCKEARAEYEARPDDIWKSTCGAYVRGLMEGFGAGAMSVAGNVHDDDDRMNAFNRTRSDMCAGAPESLYQTISDFLSWKQNPEHDHGGFLVDLFTSIRDTCDRTKPMSLLGTTELRKGPSEGNHNR